jgi:ribosomal protein S18 acetylase RimI-like enzyme
MLYRFRIIKPSDVDLLKDFLYLAYQDSMEKLDLSKEEAAPMIERYLEDWGQPGDLGFIIELKKESKPVGAAWFRQFSEQNPGYGFVDSTIPELTMAILPEYRGLGLGRDLLMRLINQARLEGFPGISLSIHKTSPAKKFYERLNFQPVRETEHTQILRRAFK